MKPELIVYNDAGEPLPYGDLLSNMVYRRTMSLYWPVEALPEHMGYLHGAEAIEGDRSRRYFLSVEAAFGYGSVEIYGNQHQPDGDIPYTEIDYDELQYLIRDRGTVVSQDPNVPAILHLYCDIVPEDHGQHGPARRLPAELRMVDPSDSKPARLDEDIPF